MGRGNVEYIISDLVAHELCRKNPQHPRIKRSLATIHAISEIRQRLHRVAGVPLSVFKSPSFIAEVVRHYNSTFLSGKSDLKLDRRNLWRIFFRREYGRELIFLPHGLSVLHNAIYIQKRYNQSDEPVVGKQKRKKAACKSPIGSDYAKIRKVTTIDQTGSPRLQYLCQNLHSNFHGSIDTSDLPNTNVIYDFVGIGHTVLSLHSTGSNGISRDDDVIVAFSTSAHFRNMQITLQKRGFCGGLDSLEMNVAQMLLMHGVRDKIRLTEEIVSDEEAVSQSLDFGFGRIQRKSMQLNWKFNKTTMPGINTKSFDKFSPKTKAQLMILFEAATQFTSKWYEDSFSDHERNIRCAGYLNSQMGFPGSRSLFEYFMMVISRNTVLSKHCDVKNCHRPGYNICCVYSYYVHVGGQEYKVSIIMTTRTTVGSAFNKALTNK
jgi:hypothetical protein